MQSSDSTPFEAALPDGRRMTLSLPPLDAPWAAGGVDGLRPVRATHEGRGDEPHELPPVPDLRALNLAVLGLGA
ncbi:hypothetical protein Q5762_03075 [Streptomyces sp. P9(2023)]|uniref:hypothetical protein n=1 Tax=Streptomyces sp. P9(2023) TaxID=3064394 RepID=UPI0028F44A3E|nr:hypothetical protein [Streptomyces sp. P9(2023)]MDT9687345.1 hypothetical protein [Streptomyces sp. P9(2023)]